MRKVLSLFLAFMFLITMCPASLAAEDNDGFKLRNGIRWGMSKDEVIATLSEGEEFSDWQRNDKDAIVIPDLKVSSVFSEGLICAFTDNRLCLAMYVFESTQPIMQLRLALRKVYGNPEPEDDLENAELSLFEMLDETLAAGEFVSDIELFEWWKLQDRTIIMLSDIDGELTIRYFNTNYIPNTVDTEGL